jgi:membrane-associated phospholipid phosphatase
VIVLAPGWPLWRFASHAAWLTGPVIRLTQACVFAAVVVLVFAWLRPQGLRCVLAVAIGLIPMYLATRAIASITFVARPFIAYHFTPLYPHYPNTSFPSFTTACFALIAVPVTLAARRLGAVAIAIAAEIAFGCVYVGVHFATDVVAGAAIGAAAGYLGWLVLAIPLLARALTGVDEALGKVRLRRRQARTMPQANSVSTPARPTST